MPACDRVRREIPSQYYVAIFKGYIILGFGVQAVEEIIDTGSGRIPSLSSVPQAAHSLAALPTNSLGGFYIDGLELRAVGSVFRRIVPRRLVPPQVLTATESDGIVAGALSVVNGNLHIIVARPLATAASSGTNPSNLPSALKTTCPTSSVPADRPPCQRRLLDPEWPTTGWLALGCPKLDGTN